MERVVLLLGGNQGDVSARMAEARAMLSESVGEILSLSQELQSEAWGFTASEKFINQALVIETTLTPEKLLDTTQLIEQRLGRDRVEESVQKQQSGEPYASRVIDIDIITYGECEVETPRLIIPHPQMHLREFVLRPMAQVSPEWRHPKLNYTTVELLNNVSL